MVDIENRKVKERFFPVFKMSRRDTERSGANSLPLGGGTGGGRFGGGGGTGASLLNPSYLNPGALVPHGSDFNERKRPAERESRFDQKESREERLVYILVKCFMNIMCFIVQEEEKKVQMDR